MPDDFYIPDLDHITGQDQKNRQSRGTSLTKDTQRAAQQLIHKSNTSTYQNYLGLLEDGVARELAREVLPVSNYTEWYWKIDLHNLFHFLSLRLHSHAQYEIRVYAEAIASLVKQWVPMAWEAFEDYHLNGMHLSGPEVQLLQAILEEHLGEERALNPEAAQEFGLSKREQREFASKLGIAFIEE